MNYWWIIQSLESFQQHSDLIGGGFKEGTEHLLHPKFGEIKRGDYIVLYGTGDKVIIGIFEIVSDMEILRGDEYWSDTPIFRIKPAVMPTEGFFVDWKKMLFDKSLTFKLFPEKTKWTYRIWNHYIHPLDSEDFEIIKSSILSHRYEISAQVEEKTILDRLGPAFGTIDLLFEPVDEMGVVYLFAKHHREIGFPFIVKLRAKYPDVIAIDTKGERKLIELEFRSSNFNHDPKGCDYIVCWIDDLEDELKKKLPQIIDLRKALSNIYRKTGPME